ncbi:hypothetical protein BC834DRAFT_962684 [Gloeopeniophorella convolvens]|nr:hypothetical protein BC834DRAFT_962684 [Gloeopeniophorella convolvens]
MFPIQSVAFGLGLALSLRDVRAQTYSATYVPTDTPPQSEQGQAGTNQCGTGFNQTSECQNAYLNNIDDWCVFAPPEPGPGSVIGNTEASAASSLTDSGGLICHGGVYGARAIPDGTITGAHFVQTPDYVQVTGVGDLTKINVPAGDAGGELDPHGADGNGNPVGGLVFSNAFTGQFIQLHEWTNFISDTEFCFRGCKDGPGAPALCQHIYDEMGCFWNMPGDYGTGFDQCAGDSGEPMGVYGTSTFFQGEPVTPDAHPAPPTSSCTTTATIGNNLAVSSANVSTSSSSSASSVGSPSLPLSFTPVSSAPPSSSAASSGPGSSSTIASSTVSVSSSASSSQTSGAASTTGSASTGPSRTSSGSNFGPTTSSGASASVRVPEVGVLLSVFGVVLAVAAGALII